MKFIEKEFLRFLKVTFPHFNEKMVTVPISFQYNLGGQHGIPSKARQIREKLAEEEKIYQFWSKHEATHFDWNFIRGEKQKKKMGKTSSELVHIFEKAASGQEAENKVYEMLQKKFSNEPCLLVHEFKENDLVKIIKENIDKKKKENRKEDDLTEREFHFFKLTNRHFVELEKQINKMMETVIEDKFLEEDIPHVLDKIEEDKPGHDLLSVKHKKNYKKNIEEFLKKKFKEGAQYTKHQLKDIILEHFLNQTYPNSEYDLLLFLKVSAIYKSFHIFF